MGITPRPPDKFFHYPFEISVAYTNMYSAMRSHRISGEIKTWSPDGRPYSANSLMIQARKNLADRVRQIMREGVVLSDSVILPHKIDSISFRVWEPEEIKNG